MRNRLVSAALGVTLALMAVPSAPEPEARAGTALRMDLDVLVAGADLVFEGRVTGARVEETPEGLIETVYTLATERLYQGAGAVGAWREVRLPGGVLPDGRGMLIPGVTRLEVGEDALLFLSAEGPRGVRMPVGLAQGRYRIETRLDGRKVAVREQGGLGLIDPASGTLADADGVFVRDYAELVADIQAAVATRAAGGGL